MYLSYIFLKHIHHTYTTQKHISLSYTHYMTHTYTPHNTHMHIPHTETIHTHISYHTIYMHTCTFKQNFLSILYNPYPNASCLCHFFVLLSSYFFFKSIRNDLLKPKFSAKYCLTFPKGLCVFQA